MANDHKITSDERRRALLRKQAEQAIKALETFGRSRYCHTADVTRGQCLGMALAALSIPQDVVDAAIASLEDWNSHLSVAAIGAIEKGDGKAIRPPYSRTLTIELPEYWAKLA